MSSGERKPVAPFYAVAALWLLCGLLLPFYSAAHYLLLAIASVIVFLLVNTVCKSSGIVDAQPEPPQPESAPAPSGGSAGLDNMLQTGQAAIAEMKRLNDAIAAPGISAGIARLEQVSASIFQAVRDDPAKLPQTRRFMDYYLPTTLKLLNAYARMSAAGVSGENISASLAKIETMMHTVVRAFEKQLDALYGADALDVSAEVSVLESMMAREGLSGGPAGQDPGGIHLEF